MTFVRLVDRLATDERGVEVTGVTSPHGKDAVAGSELNDNERST